MLASADCVAVVSTMTWSLILRLAPKMVRCGPSSSGHHWQASTTPVGNGTSRFCWDIVFMAATSRCLLNHPDVRREGTSRQHTEKTRERHRACFADLDTCSELAIWLLPRLDSNQQ